GSQRALCVGVFAIAAATLMYEILLTRIFSVTMWYHFAFLAVAAALLGMTAGAGPLPTWPPRPAPAGCPPPPSPRPPPFPPGRPPNVRRPPGHPLQPDAHADGPAVHPAHRRRHHYPVRVQRHLGLPGAHEVRWGIGHGVRGRSGRGGARLPRHDGCSRLR